MRWKNLVAARLLNRLRFFWPLGGLRVWVGLGEGVCGQQRHTCVCGLSPCLLRNNSHPQHCHPVTFLFRSEPHYPFVAGEHPFNHVPFLLQNKHSPAVQLVQHVVLQQLLVGHPHLDRVGGGAVLQQEGWGGVGWREGSAGMKI